MRYTNELSRTVSKTSEQGRTSDALFRHARDDASSGLPNACEPRARSAMPHDLQSACAYLSDSGDLYTALVGPEADGAGDQASHEAWTKRRLEALRGLIEQPATGLGSVFAKALIVSHFGKLAHDDETESGQLAIEVVHEMAKIRCVRDDLEQDQPSADSTLARGCREFFLFDKAYEGAVRGGQATLAEIDAARRFRAGALAMIMSRPATTMAETVAKAEIVSHFSVRAPSDNATTLGLLATTVLDELLLIAGGA